MCMCVYHVIGVDIAEMEADEMSVHLMVASGYNPYALCRVLHKIEKETKRTIKGRLISAQPEWLLTHPLTSNRVSHLKDTIRELYPQYECTGYC